MTFFQGRGQVGSNLSIDRIDNNKTYSKDNITFCTQNFNHKKGPLTVDTMMPSDALEVDHCHITGQFRGWICKNCNTGLGKFFDDSQFLIKAIEYLHKNPVPVPEQQQLSLPLEEPNNEME
jgi:acetamidase/formamidase